MSDTRTPIERMVDAACGFDPTSFVRLRCLKKGCPRTRLIERPDDVGKNVAEIHSFCPWHTKEGWKEYPETYYDAQGRELAWEGWKPRVLKESE